MQPAGRRHARTFDVICAGEALWKLPPRGSPRQRTPLIPGGGPISTALALARRGLRVGVATVLADDTFARAYVATIAASGVDVAGLTFAYPRKGVVLIEGLGGANSVPSDAEEQPPFELPAGWSSQILLLSGLSPVTSHAAALCKAARAARRAGTFVLLDFDASLHLWLGRDPRTIRMVLREVDAARCGLADLAVLGMDLPAVRGALRPDAVLAVSDAEGGAVATGPFGEVVFVPPEASRPMADGAGDARTVAICAELIRAGKPGESPGARWYRALQRGHDAASDRE